MSTFKLINTFFMGFFLGIGACILIIILAMGNGFEDFRPIIEKLLRVYIIVGPSVTIAMSFIRWLIHRRDAHTKESPDIS